MLSAISSNHRVLLMMSSALPITITIAQALQQQAAKFSAAGNKLEALFNFRTMTAGWYGDEDNILTIDVVWETSQGLIQRQESREQQAQNVEYHQISDDAFALFKLPKLNIFCVIAVTENELNLISNTPKLLQPLLDKKMVKVLNFIAKQQKLFPIE